MHGENLYELDRVEQGAYSDPDEREDVDATAHDARALGEHTTRPVAG
jgi:hypothetical protein